MMTSLGYKVIHYGAEGSDVPCAENVVVLDDATQKEVYGDFDWHKHYWNFKFDDHAYMTFAKRATEEILARRGNNDLLLTVSGKAHAGVANETGLTAVEYAIGYEGVFSRHRVFGSYAWMHYIYGILSTKTKSFDGNWYDAVIPHYFNPDDFELSEDKDDYFVYIGRLVPRKGPHIASQVCSRLGKKLIVAGQGDPKAAGLTGSHIEYVGTVGVKERKELLKAAKAVFVPTVYIEPFGMTSVEALMCGTPVISTDWGAFTENIIHGKVGFRCRTMDDFLWAARNVDKIDPKVCHNYAVDNFSYDVVKYKYDEYFMKIADLWSGGWYEIHPERSSLDWLVKKCP